MKLTQTTNKSLMITKSLNY